MYWQEKMLLSIFLLFIAGGGGSRILEGFWLCFNKIYLISLPPPRLCSILICYSIVFGSILLYSVIDDWFPLRSPLKIMGISPESSDHPLAFQVMNNDWSLTSAVFDILGDFVLSWTA